MNHLDIISSHFDFPDKDVADIGAGAGNFAAQLQSLGARVTGIEVDPVRIAAVSEGLPAGLSLIEGRAESLPLEARSQDLLCFIQSMHHVPAGLQHRALSEARRVLRPGGRLHVAEPRPFGSMFEVVRMVEDETQVRTETQARMDRVGAADGFGLIAKSEYDMERPFTSFGDFLKLIVFVDPDRTARLAECRDRVKSVFEDAAASADGRYLLVQPCVSWHFGRR